MKKANNDIRNEAKAAGVKLWQIAEKLCIREEMLSRKLRHELPEEEKAQIKSIIKELEKEGE